MNKPRINLMVVSHRGAKTHSHGSEGVSTQPVITYLIFILFFADSPVNTCYQTGRGLAIVLSSSEEELGDEIQDDAQQASNPRLPIGFPLLAPQASP